MVNGWNMFSSTLSHDNPTLTLPLERGGDLKVPPPFQGGDQEGDEAQRQLVSQIQGFLRFHQRFVIPQLDLHPWGRINGKGRAPQQTIVMGMGMRIGYLHKIKGGAKDSR
jgi:hypothetical protein